MQPRSLKISARILAVALFTMYSVGVQGASWPQTTGQTLFDEDFSNCNWTADTLKDRSCGFALGTPPVGTYDVTNGAIRIRVTKEWDQTRGHHHTDMVPLINGPDERAHGQIGEAYWYGVSTYLENWTDDHSWEILSQWHGIADSDDNKPRNPPVALQVQDSRYSLMIRADSSKVTAPPDSPSRYDRQDKIDLGPVASNVWVDWVFKIKWDPFGTDGFLVVWKNGKVVYEEYGAPNTFNDARGPVWSIGLYKYFSGADATERRMRLDNVRAALVGSDDPDAPLDKPQIPTAPEVLAAEPISDSTINISWRDTADSTSGFVIERQESGDSGWEEAGSVTAEKTEFADTSLAPGTTYSYQVKAFNSTGTSKPSNTRDATTLEGIDLRTFNYKKRGYHKVFLTFFYPSGGAVEIYRDGRSIETTTEDVFLDEVDKRGKAVYKYKVCDATNTDLCSQLNTVVF